MSNFTQLEKTKARFITKTQLRFYAAILFKLKVEYSSPGDGVKTAATNGKWIKVNQPWFEELDGDQQVGLLAHEVKHVANKHALRRGNRARHLWNIATDHVINLECIEEGLYIPENGYADEQYRGMSAEQVYTLLSIDEPDDEPGDKPGDKPDDEPDDGTGWGDVVDYTGEDGPASESELAEAEARINRDIINAARAAKAAGNIPGGVQRLVDEILDPKVDWREELKSYVSVQFRDDYSWARGNRRYLYNGLYLPSMVSNGLVDIVVAIDTSGSMTRKELAQVSAEIDAILQDYPARIHVVYCDARVNGHMEVESSDCPVQLEMKGGGGTAFQPVFDWIEEHDINPVLCIYFTDLCGPAPREPEYPVLWVTHEKSTEGFFGETLRM